MAKARVWKWSNQPDSRNLVKVRDLANVVCEA